jgi:hypothetical protein
MSYNWLRLIEISSTPTFLLGVEFLFAPLRQFWCNDAPIMNMTPMRHDFGIAGRTVSAVAGAVMLTLSASALVAAEMAPLDIQLPIPAFMGTPTDIPMTEHIEKPSDKPRPPFMAPKGVMLLSLDKSVTSSDKNPINGYPELVTDGDKEAGDSSVLELHRKLQWVQIDLEAAGKIYVVVVWHAHDTPQVVHDVIVQLADDADFTQNVRTVYNNDYDNSAGLGVGKDKEYFENYEGRLIDAKGQSARYVRLYSQGSTYTALNRYTEVEVYGLAE